MICDSRAQGSSRESSCAPGRCRCGGQGRGQGEHSRPAEGSRPV